MGTSGDHRIHLLLFGLGVKRGCLNSDFKLQRQTDGNITTKEAAKVGGARVLLEPEDAGRRFDEVKSYTGKRVFLVFHSQCPHGSPRQIGDS